ncbi:MAG: hypothetical protein M3Q27_12095 [Actinomycetota bacterium]|nr:hypothetical protein [Actinomycetota bacterium]
MGWGGYSYLFGPLTALAVVGVLALLLRWAFGRGGSLVERRSRPGHEGEYGLLVSVASPATYVEGEMMRLRLSDAGMKATLATTSDGPRIMVFAADEARARRVLAGSA